MASSPQLTSSSLIRPIRKSHDFHVSKSDKKPTPLIQELDKETSADDNNDGTTKQSSCQVCNTNQARYTCPNCELPYCSVTCYQSHCQEDSVDSCTERFYRKRVTQVLDLEVKEKKDDTKRLLARIHQQSRSAIPQEELLNMLRVIEEGDEQEISRILSSPHVRSALELAIEQGELQEWLVEPWTPWWRPDLGSGDVEEGDSDDDEVACSATVTLDERLLKIPSFSTIRPGNKPTPNLVYNLLDLVYGVAWTLRLYHGLSNALEQPIASASTLVQSSSVLSKDARYETLAEVLSSRVAASTSAMETNNCNTPWDTLVKDVAWICKNKRMICRALLEAKDILSAAVSAAKSAGDGKGTSEMRRWRKKADFYLSWTNDCFDPDLSISEDVDFWASEWRLVRPEPIDVLYLPTDHLPARKAPETRRQEPLLQVVSETRQNR